MSALFRALRGRAGERQWPTIGLEDWGSYFNFGGLSYPLSPQTTLAQQVEEPPSDFGGYVSQLYKSNGVVFACMGARQRLFSEATFQFQRIRTGELFGSPALAPLEQPWGPSSTTGDLLMRMIQDVDLAGNAFIARLPDGNLSRCRPDWVTIVTGSKMSADDSPNWQLDARIIGFLYYPGGKAGGMEPQVVMPWNMAHFIDTPDPTARWRGMSWLTPIVREVMADSAAMTHKLMFFQQGAAQPLDSNVLTPDGWKPMGTIRQGSDVTGPDGKPRRVLGVYPQGIKDVYRVTFSGGLEVECCADHLWRVCKGQDRELGRSRVMKLRDILEDGVRYRSGPLKYTVPLVEPVEYAGAAERKLPVDPYLLGMLLGDGHLGRRMPSGSRMGVSMAAGHDGDWLEGDLACRLPANVLINRRDRQDGTEFYFGRTAGSDRANALVDAIERTGLYGLRGHDKFIPLGYQRALVSDRVALLQGIVDSDGSIEPGGGVSVSTTSERLANDLLELARGLGGIASIRPVSKTHRPQWRVRVRRLPGWIVPSRMPRKRRAYLPSNKYVDRERFIRSIELVRRAPVQCIKVDAHDGLYVTDGYVVTHNTPNLVVEMGENVTPENFQKFTQLFEEQQEGVLNAYKTLFFGGGAKVEVVGANLQQMDFKVTQGHGETRIAAAAGVPPIVANLSEGLENATYSNFSQARRAFGDGTIRPLWRKLCGSMQPLVDMASVNASGSPSRLWYDARRIPFLREDTKDEAQVVSTQAAAINTLITAGFEPDAAITAVVGTDLGQLKGGHSGLVSVQLLPPGAQGTNGSSANGNGAVPADAPAP